MKILRLISTALAAALIMTAAALPVCAAEKSASYSSLSMASKTSNASGTGWSWNAKTKTLTLKDVTISGKKVALTLPTGDVTLKLSGKNHINVTAQTQNAVYGIYAKGSLTVTGTGSLDCNVISSNGVAGGIKADALKMNGSGSIQLNVSGGVNEASPRGIYVTDGAEFNNGFVGVSVQNTNRNKKCISYGLLASKGDVTIGPNGYFKAIVNAADNARGIYAKTGGANVKGKLALGITSLNAASRGMETADSISADGGKINIAVTAPDYAFGLWSDEKITLKSSAVKIEAKSSQTAPLSSAYAQNYSGYMQNSAFGIGCNGILGASSSTLGITAKASGCPSCGLFSYDNVCFSRCKFTVNCTSTSSSAFGLRNLGGEMILLSDCTGTIKAATASVLAENDLEISGTSVAKGLHVGVCEYNDKTYCSINRSLSTKVSVGNDFTVSDAATDITLQ